MPTATPSFVKVVAVKSLELAIRFWPDESRHWGQALLAETHEITHPVEAFFWALGGVTVFFRSHLSHLLALLKLPAGRTTAPLPAGSEGRRFPRHSRLLTAIVLLCALTFYFLPYGREAATTVASTWSGFEPTRQDRRAIEGIAARAEREKDARMLAFAAISYPDPARSSAFADKAVALDPHLVWVYASRSRFFRTDDVILDERNLSQLHSYDPDNAFVYLVAADTAPQSHSYTPEAAQLLLSDSTWTSLMDHAFHAGHYDGYAKQHLELIRDAWRANPDLSPTIIAYSLWSYRLPNVFAIRTYADEQVRVARATAAAGRKSEAESRLQEVVRFGYRMVEGSGTDFERSGARAMTSIGLKALHTLYLSEGRPADAAIMSSQQSAIESAEKARRSFWNSHSASFSRYRMKALAVQISGVLALIVSLLIILSLADLELGSLLSWSTTGFLRRLVCWTADYGPPSLLVIGGVFLLSFRPFGAALAQYRDGATAQQDLPWQLIPLQQANPLSFLPEEYYGWLVLTVLLALIAFAIVLRAILQRKPMPR